MNRRSFISNIIVAGVSAAILPAATTYARQWIFARGVVQPKPFDIYAFMDQMYAIKRERLAASGGVTDTEIYFVASREQCEAFREKLKGMILEYYHRRYAEIRRETIIDVGDISSLVS